MKKIVSIFCILLLLVATSNLAVNIHFCGDAISSLTFSGKSKTCGSTCDSKTGIHEKSCCKDFAAVISTDDTTTANFSFNVEQQIVATVPVTYVLTFENTHSIELLKGSVACNAPPNISDQHFYILYNSLII